MRPFLEISYCHKNFGKNKIEILPFLEELGPNFHIKYWAKIKKTYISLVLLTFLSSMRLF